MIPAPLPIPTGESDRLTPKAFKHKVAADLRCFWKGKPVKVWIDESGNARSDLMNGMPRPEWQRVTS